MRSGEEGQLLHAKGPKERGRRKGRVRHVVSGLAACERLPLASTSCVDEDPGAGGGGQPDGEASGPVFFGRGGEEACLPPGPSG